MSVGADYMGSEMLSSKHEAILLAESGIDPGLVASRGYRTVETKAQLERLGFGRSQRNVPGLLLPIYGPLGGIVSYQFRPDEPRIGRTVYCAFRSWSRRKIRLKTDRLRELSIDSDVAGG